MHAGGDRLTRRRGRREALRRELDRAAKRSSRVRRTRARVRRWTRWADPIGVRYRRALLWRPLRVGLLATGALVLLGAVWIVITAVLAQQQAQRIDARLSQVRTYIALGDVTGARKAAASLPDMARRASRLTSGPAWWTASHLPIVGEPFDTARAGTDASLQINGVAVPELMRVASGLNPGALRVAGSTIDVSPLAAAAEPLQHAAAVIRDATDELTHAPSDTWLSPVDDGRRKLLAQLNAVHGYVDAAARAARLLPGMLGADGPKRYFIGLQNEAELRGTGGLPGAFAIAVASRGTIKFTRFGSDAILLPDRTNQRVPTDLDFGSDYNDAYGASIPTSSFQNSNVSPHFPYAAQIWAAMWTKVSGEKIDGVLALDPTTLAYFLNTIGPTTLPSGGVITGQNVVALTQQIQYSVFTDNTQRRQFVVSVLKAVADRLTSGAGNPVDLLRAVSLSSSEKRLLAWSRDPLAEAALARTNFAGAVPDDDQPFAGLILNNGSGGKIDFYVKRTLTYSRTGCGPTRHVVAHFTIRNEAPATGLPPYVVTRLDDPPVGSRPGGVRQIADYYATRGATFSKVTVNGRPVAATVLSDRGHPIFRLDLDIPQGSTQDIVYDLTEPAGTKAPYIWQQPGVNPIEVQAFDAPCGQ